MNVDATRALVQRRGTVVGWQHAVPLGADELDPFTRGPRASLGGAVEGGGGGFGERYLPEVKIRALSSSKNAWAMLALWGMVETGDMNLTIATPFEPEPDVGIGDLPPELLEAYNTGSFGTLPRDGSAPAFDRFRFAGRLWVVKAPAVPLIDGDVTFAWRVLVTKWTQ